MLLNSFYILVGLVLLAAGAETLVRGASGLAFRLGVTALAVGLTVVAFGTSSPELATCIEAARSGRGSIALGNIIGSNISNILLIIGTAAIVRPMNVRSELVRREMPLMILASSLLWIMLLDRRIGRIEGGFLLIGSIAYAFFSLRSARKDKDRSADSKLESAVVGPKDSLWISLTLVAAGFAVLVAGADILLKGALFVARTCGISELVIGLTIVAVGTSLPELATSIVSAVRGKEDVAFGNAIGSNVMNILAVLGTTALIHPVEAPELRSWDLSVMLASGVALLMLMKRGWVLNRWEGALLVIGYAAYALTLFH